MLGVTFTNYHVSISEHISDVICGCAQSLYAIKVLRCHGMNEEELRLVFKTVLLAKILYATPAWWGFTSAADRRRIEAFCPSLSAAWSLPGKRRNPDAANC